MSQAVTKRAGRKAAAAPKAAGKQAPSKAVVRKAVYETSRKKEVGVSDLTLLSKITNEAINDNLRKRFEHQEIYVPSPCDPPFAHRPIDVHWPCPYQRQSLP